MADSTIAAIIFGLAAFGISVSLLDSGLRWLDARRIYRKRLAQLKEL